MARGLVTGRKLGHVAALLVYGMLAVILTYPIVVRVGEALPGPHGDNWQYFWNLWWMRQVVANPGTNLFHTDYLYYPSGVNLYFDTLTMFDAFMTLPLQLLFNAFVAYNVAVWAAFALSGWGAYLLADYLLGDRGGEDDGNVLVGLAGRRLAAFVAGFIFAFSPYHFAHLLGHLNLVAMQWMPLYILFLFKAQETGKWRFVPAAAIFLALTALADWYYVMYLLIFTAIYLGYRFFTARRKAFALTGEVVRLAGVMAVFTLLVSPVLIPTLKEAFTTSYAVYDPIQTLHHSPDLLAFFAPSPFHPLWGEAASQWSNIYHSPLAEKIVFAGYLPMGLAIVGLWRGGRRNRFWLIVAAIFFVLSLGPILHLGGRTTFTAFETTVPLPYLALYYLPLVKASRAVARFDVIVMLALAVLAAAGLVALMRSARRRRWPVLGRFHLAIPVLAFLVIGFEFLAVPFPTSEPEVPSFYEEIAKEEGEFAILDIPFSLIRSRYLLYQTVHGKKIVGGYISRVQPFPFVLHTPAVQQLSTLRADTDINSIELSSMGENVLDYYDIRYVVVHKKLDKPDAVDKAMKMAAEIFGRPPDYEDELAAAFRVKPRGRALFVSVGPGWHDKESTEIGHARWMASSASLELVSSIKGTARLSFTAWSFDHPRTLQVYAGGKMIGEFAVEPGSPREYAADPFDVAGGSTELVFKSGDPPQSPASVGYGEDPRPLSISVARVRVSE